MRDKLEKLLRFEAEKFPGVMGIGVKDLEEGDKILVNGDEVFPIGSSIKIPILIEFFNKAEAGVINLDELLALKEEYTVGGSGVLQELQPGKVTMSLLDYATLMITVSDNVATNILIDIVGMEDVNRTLTRLGLERTKLRRKMMDYEAAKAGQENVSTPREMIELMDRLYRGKGLSPYVCESTLNIMKKPKLGVIRASVPDEIPVADKSGGVEGVSCDIGIVFLPRRPYAIAVMTKHIPISDFHGLDTRRTMIHVTGLVQTYFQEMDLATPLGRRVPR
ncbi:MAG: serine hydrolase [Candidatus Bathyarchaeia archaeon]